MSVPMDLNSLTEFLHAAARSLGAEAPSPWVSLQAGLVLSMLVLIGSASTAVFAVLMTLARVVMLTSTWPSRSYLLSVAANLAFAWLIIRLVTSVIRNTFIVRLVSLSAWLVAALSILGLLEPTIDALDSVSIVLGGLRLTPLLLVKLCGLLAVALWLTNIASNFAESRITRSGDLTPSIQVLLVKMVRLALMIFAVAVVLGAGGTNLSALAIFSGAAW